ncbi:MAG TPA: Gfo/Idh/MocA family oxidoreductase [bacterium]|nr:Gfo/Idh/MocA family oxidoreductase [bacterium]
MEKTYNVGIIGTGFIGGVHAYGFSNLKYYYPESSFKVKLFGICDVRNEVLQKFRDNHNFSFATTDCRELINHPDIDIIDICSPNVFHKEQILESIKAGKHIYCEKPIVSDLKESEQVIEALKGFKKIHQMTFNSRFFPTSVKAKEIIEEGKLGKPVSFRIAYHHSGSIEKDKPMGWKQEKGAGVALDLGAHVIDMLYYFWGEVSEVSAITRILYPERKNREGKMVAVNAEDYFSCNARLKNGAIGNIEASKIATGAEDEIQYELFGTEGALKFNSMHPNFLLCFNQDDPHKGYSVVPVVSRYPESTFPGPKFSVGWIRGHVHSIYKFLCSVDSNTCASPSFYDGHYNMKVVEAAIQSDRSRTWIPVK